MDKFDYSQLSKNSVLNQLNTDNQKGLSFLEVEKRLNRFGKNEIETRKTTTIEILIRQMKSPFIYLLFGAGLIAFIIGEHLDGLMILLFILINTILGFFQEYKSERTFKMLKNYILSYAKVVRQGKIHQILFKNIVPGDIVIIEAGDKVPADMRLIESNSIVVDESILTGESIPINKVDHQLTSRKPKTLTLDNLVYSGSTVVGGSGKGIVYATGKDTSFGKIAELTLDTHTLGGFEKTLSKFSNFILKIVSVTLVLLLGANLILRPGVFDLPTYLIFAIALAVAVIPQALPLVMTFSLSIGANKLAKQKVAVRRLSAIEDLGSLNILCTDKTGTITKNKLDLESVYPGSDDQILINANLAASVQPGSSLDPFDIGLWNSLSIGDQKLLSEYLRIEYFPFNPEKRRNGVLVSLNDKKILIFRGAVESIVNRSKLSDQEKNKIFQWVDDKGEDGIRCLAVARKEIKEDEKINLENQWDEGDLKFIGVIGFKDPIKESTYQAVKKAKQLGIDLKVITGDSKKVALAVGREIGLVSDQDGIISGFDFQDLTTPEKRKAVNENKILARFTPEQKYQVVGFLGEKNRVGFLGDGVNDAPALKKANVSLVVANSTDIAREVSDIVLLERDLGVIVNGIREGRKVFGNTIKYLLLTLSANFGNFYAVAAASLFIDFLPMLPIQVLLLNLLSDFPMIAVATDSVDQEVVDKPRRYEVKNILIMATILGLVSTLFDFGFFFHFYRKSPAILQTSWFIGSVLTELVLIFSIRTRKLFVKGAFPSLALIGLALVAGIVTIILPFVDFGQRYFQFEQISRFNLTIVFIIVGLYFIATEIAKLIYYRLNND